MGEDIKSLMTNGSFMFSTLGFTCVTFCTGALSWWAPKFLKASIYKKEIPIEAREIGIDNVSFIFGVITMLAGIVGVIVGATSSTVLKRRFPRADPLICGAGLASCSAILALGLFGYADSHLKVTL